MPLPAVVPPAGADGRYFVTDRGAAVYISHWPVPAGAKPKAALCFLPGYNSYGNAIHAMIASHFTAAGIECFALDHAGFGRSVEELAAGAPGVPRSAARSCRTALCCFGLRGYVPRFQDLVDDAACFVRSLREEQRVPADAPIFLTGESMGGAVALETSRVARDVVAGILLVAPMSGIDKAVTPPGWQVVLGCAAAALLPTLPAFILKDLTPHTFRDPSKRAEVKLDPLRWHPAPRLATAFQLRGATLAIQGRLHEYTCPMVVLHGTADVVCPLSTSRALFQLGGARDKTLVEYESAWHALYVEPVLTRRRIMADMLAWVAARAPGVKDPIAAGILPPGDDSGAGSGLIPEAAAAAGGLRVTRPYENGPFGASSGPDAAFTPAKEAYVLTAMRDGRLQAAAASKGGGGSADE